VTTRLKKKKTQKTNKIERRDEINARPGRILYYYNDIRSHCVTGDFANRSQKFLSAGFVSITITLQTST